MATSRSGNETSQTMGNRINASNANGQEIANKRHHAMNRIRIFMDQELDCARLLEFRERFLDGIEIRQFLGRWRLFAVAHDALAVDHEGRPRGD